jgi:hypothetical protein
MMNTTEQTPEQKIVSKIKEIEQLLLSKNASYGNSALSPLGVFSALTPVKAICARIDDKLNRIKNKGITDQTEDTITDLIGYLILLKIALEDDANNSNPNLTETNNYFPKSFSNGSATYYQSVSSNKNDDGWPQKFFTDY